MASPASIAKHPIHPMLVVLPIGLWIFSAFRANWKPRLALVWLAGLAVIGALMWGGVLGLRFVENERWGGLILTLLLSTFGLAVAFPLVVVAQDTPTPAGTAAVAVNQKPTGDTEWDLENHGVTRRDQSIDTTEGTWISLDVSPDGQQIVFDLLGDIYIMPITGATGSNNSPAPRRITSGPRKGFVARTIAKRS